MLTHPNNRQISLLQANIINRIFDKANQLPQTAVRDMLVDARQAYDEMSECMSSGTDPSQSINTRYSTFEVSFKVNFWNEWLALANAYETLLKAHPEAARQEGEDSMDYIVRLIKANYPEHKPVLNANRVLFDKMFLRNWYPGDTRG